MRRRVAWQAAASESYGQIRIRQAKTGPRAARKPAKPAKPGKPAAPAASASLRPGKNAELIVRQGF